MSNLANSLQSSLEQFVRPHSVKASFPIDRLINRLAFMTVIVQAVAILAANFAAQAKVTCATEADGSKENGSAATAATASVADKVYAESYCYSRGVDQTGLPDGTIPASFDGVLRHYLLQFYLPIVFIIQAGTVYLPYYVWSQTAGECLRQNIQFVVELSKKLLADDAEGSGGGGDGCNSEETCRHRRMQQGRPSKADLLTDATLKQRLRRWYCKSKHTGRYCAFQLARAAVIAGWMAFYAFFPGFRHEDVRYRFVCYLPDSRGTSGHRRFNCVLLQASIYEVGWSTNMSLLAFCLLATARQLFYFFPFVLGCRCRQCRTKRCLSSCGK
uniref:Innexin n=3 Tax=Macrostomum lignano TaxID=282301 RepID=A0A1I8J165_9PLAT